MSLLTVYGRNVSKYGTDESSSQAHDRFRRGIQRLGDTRTGQTMCQRFVVIELT